MRLMIFIVLYRKKMINKLKTVRKLSGFICNSSSSDYICNGEYEWDLEINELVKFFFRIY